MIYQNLSRKEKIMRYNNIGKNKENGIVYTSFKYGNDSCERNGRYFTDFTSESFHDFMLKIPFALVEEWQSSDIRPGRENEKWLNLILRKK